MPTRLGPIPKVTVVIDWAVVVALVSWANVSPVYWVRRRRATDLASDAIGHRDGGEARGVGPEGLDRQQAGDIADA